MQKQKKQSVGRTKDSGWQIGVRRTLSIAPQDAWRYLTSDEGLRLWLGEVSNLTLDQGETYQLPDGGQGEVRVYKPLSHLRITWQPPEWERPSTIQVRVISKGERTVIAFHQEHLPSAEAREARRKHFQTALDTLEQQFGIS